MTPAPLPGLEPGLVTAFVLLDLVIIWIAARSVGRLAQMIGQPRVVGEIVAGVILGPSLLGPKIFVWNDSPWFLHCDQGLTASGVPEGTQPSITSCVFPLQARGVLGIIGQIALVLFMFLVGLELDWGALRGKGRGIFTVALGVVAIPLALAFVIGPILFDAPEKWVGLGDPSQNAFNLMIGAMLAVTAFPVMARILQEKGLTQSNMGAVGVAAAAAVTVLMFLLVAVATGVAKDQTTGDQVKRFVGAAIFIAVLFVVVRPALERTLGRNLEAKGALTPAMFAAVFILMFSSAYVADRIGINVIVGGFLMGSVMPARQLLFREMSSRLTDITATILLPVFLAFSGLNTDFTKIGITFLGGVALFLVAGIVGKWAGGAISARLGGLTWPEGNVLGILMNCRGLLVLVVGLIAFNAGVISPQLQVAGVLMALVTTAMTGPLFDRFAPAAAPTEAAAKKVAATPTVAESVIEEK